MLIRRLSAVLAALVVLTALPALAGEKLDIEGRVTYVYPRYDEIGIRAGSEEYVVKLGPDTAVRRYIYATNIYDIGEGSWISISGTVYDDIISAQRIRINSGGKSSRPHVHATGRGDRYAGLEDVVEGEVTYAAAWFDRALTIRTSHGERKIDVPRGAQVVRERRPVSVHDLRKGEVVRAYGEWQGGTLVATRVEVIDRLTEPPAEPAARDRDAPDTTAPAETANDRTGRIIAIDYDTCRMTIDAGLNDVSVNAAEAVIARKGSSRRFGDLKKGDRVRVEGEVVDGVVQATTVDILE